MGYISGMNREQVVLFPESVDEYIEENNLVRFIDAYVDSLNLATLGLTHAVSKETWRPCYPPADLLKLYIYGYLYKIRSSRKLAQETHRNVELMWLLHKLKADFKTSADVRQDHAEPLRQVCREFTLLGKKRDLFGQELIALAGSKFRAINRKDRHCNESKLKQWLKHLHDQSARDLKECDQQDGLESSLQLPTVDELNTKIAPLQDRRHHYDDLRQRLEGSGASQIS